MSETELAPQERLQKAGRDFQELNRTLPAGMQPFQIPPYLEVAAGLDALLRILIEKDLIDDERAFVDAKVTRMAEMVEEMSAAARELKRQASGLVVAGPNGAV